MTRILTAPLTGLATVLELAAELLRALAGSISRLSFRSGAAAHPLGYWRCTHVSESFAHDFTVGSVYEARHEPAGTSCIRVIPQNHAHWAPYWDARQGRFCYEPHQIDFEYVGARLPEGTECWSGLPFPATNGVNPLDIPRYAGEF